MNEQRSWPEPESGMPGETKLIPGLVSVTFRRLAPGEIIALVRQAGLRAIEWGGDAHVPHGDLAAARAVRAMTDAAGLVTAAYGSYYRVGESEEAGLPFDTVLDTAVALRAPTVRVWAGARGSAEADSTYRERVIRDSRRIADLAGAAGVTISYEYHSRTLTDTNESALALLREVDHSNVYTCWQPPNGREVEYCLRGLVDILPRLTNVHAFHWWPTSTDRHPLAEGEDRWSRYLQAIAADDRAHFVLLEFVPGDEPAAFLRDAATLRRWLGHPAP